TIPVTTTEPVRLWVPRSSHRFRSAPSRRLFGTSVALALRTSFLRAPGISQLFASGRMLRGQTRSVSRLLFLRPPSVLAQISWLSFPSIQATCSPFGHQRTCQPEGLHPVRQVSLMISVLEMVVPTSEFP